MSGAGAEAPGGRQVSRDERLRSGMEDEEWGPGVPAHGAVEAGGGPAGQGEGAQRVGGADEGGVVASARERVEGTEEEQVLGVGAVVSVGGESLRGFDDDGGREVEVVVGGDGIAVLGDGGDLSESVEGASAVQLGVDDGEGFERVPRTWRSFCARPWRQLEPGRVRR